MTQYIEIRNWDKFQHADATKRGKDPKWIKLYTRLHSDDDFLALTGHQRAVLLGLWLEYARSGRHLRLTTRSLSARLNLRVMTRDLEAIKNHGFILIRHDNVQTTSGLEEKREEKRQQLHLPLRTTDPVDVGDLVGDGEEPASGGLGASGVLVAPGSVLEQVEARAAAELGGAQVFELASRQVARALADEFMDSLPREA